MNTSVKFISDTNLDTMRIAGGRFNYRPTRQANLSRSNSSSQPKEVISLQTFNVSFSFAVSFTNLTVVRTGAGAGQGSPVVINIG